MFKLLIFLHLLSVSVLCCQRKHSNVNLLDKSERKCGDNNKATVLQDYTFLYEYLTGTGAHRFHDSVTIGFLAAYGQTQVVLGALPLAVEAVNNNSGKK